MDLKSLSSTKMVKKKRIKKSIHNVSYLGCLLNTFPLNWSLFDFKKEEQGLKNTFPRKLFYLFIKLTAAEFVHRNKIENKAYFAALLTSSPF